MIPSEAVGYDDGFCRMFVGDAIKVLSELPEKSVHTCVTSPPYFGLRSYLAVDHPDKAREGGTQETPEQYVQWLVEVFRGVWRVLRDDGTLWLNLGDSYANGGTQGGSQSLAALADRWSPNKTPRNPNRDDRGEVPRSQKRIPPGLKSKDLLMIPARVALALQADGWYLRSQIVWTKPNPMPESVTDRPTQATEMVYLLTKKPRYFYDVEAVKEKATYPEGPWGGRNPRPGIDVNGGGQASSDAFGKGLSGRNLRNYWQISTRPYPGSHYATFPPELPLRCIKAGTSEHGVCSECRAPWRRVVEREANNDGYPNGPGGKQAKTAPTGLALHSGTLDTVARYESRTIGFEPTCSHDAPVIPATVLDPFSGSGTTGLVARKLGRRSVLMDLDDRNVRLLEQRMGYQGVLL